MGKTNAIVSEKKKKKIREIFYLCKKTGKNRRILSTQPRPVFLLFDGYYLLGSILNHRMAVVLLQTGLFAQHGGNAFQHIRGNFAFTGHVLENLRLEVGGNFPNVSAETLAGRRERTAAAMNGASLENLCIILTKFGILHKLFIINTEFTHSCNFFSLSVNAFFQTSIYIFLSCQYHVSHRANCKFSNIKNYFHITF